MECRETHVTIVSLMMHLLLHMKPLEMKRETTRNNRIVGLGTP